MHERSMAELLVEEAFNTSGSNTTVGGLRIICAGETTSGRYCFSSTTAADALVAGLIVNLVVGAACLLLFCAGYHKLKVYWPRLLRSDRSGGPLELASPPSLRLRSPWRAVSWLWAVLTVTETELLAAVGFDGYVLDRRVSRPPSLNHPENFEGR
jgi:hypothetical protein